MSYLALYRAFRPKTFDEIIGQEHIVRTLVNQIKSNKIGHAYLFCGARGTGKTTAAKVFARAINCLSPVNGSPCGQCEVCKKLENPANLDIVEMDAASNNKVENVRDIRDKVQYPPVAGKYKVYIIDEVHMLTTEAFNALLKTLEEPPAHAVFILATTEVHKLPATILSRCLRFDFKLIPTPTIAKLIAGIYDKIGKKYTPEAVNAIARAGEGSVRDALSVADVCVSYSDGELTYDDVIEVLGTSDRTHIEKLISEIVGGNTGGILSVVDELCMHGKSVAVLNRDVCNAIRDLLVIKTCTDPQAILGLPKDKLDELKKLADKTDVHALLRYLELFSAAEADLKYSTHPRIVFETAAVKAGMPQADYNIDALLARMSAMEKQLQELSARPVVLPLTNNERPVAVEVEKTTSVKAETVKTTVADRTERAAAEHVVKPTAVKPEESPAGKPTVAKAVEQKNRADEENGFYMSADDIPPADDGGFFVANEGFGEKPRTENGTVQKPGGSPAFTQPTAQKIAQPTAQPIAQPAEAKSAATAMAKTAGSATDEGAERVWGATLRAMRKDKEIMLWAACEDVGVYAADGVFYIRAGGENEFAFLSKPDNTAKLRNYICAEGYSDVKIVSGEGEETDDGSSGEETDKVKNLFQGEKLTIKD